MKENLAPVEQLPSLFSKGGYTNTGYRIIYNGLCLQHDGKDGKVFRVQLSKPDIGNKGQVWFIVEPVSNGEYFTLQNFYKKRIVAYTVKDVSHEDKIPQNIFKQMQIKNFRPVFIPRQNQMKGFLMGAPAGATISFENFKTEGTPFTLFTGKQSEYEIPPAMQLNAALSDFVYPDNIEQILNANKKVDVMGVQNVIVDDENINTTITTEFTKSYKKSFSWGLNQKIGLELAVTIDASIPVIGGGMSSTLSTSFEAGSHQDWTQEQETITKVSHSMNTDKKGVYRMTGWVDFVKDLKLPFKCKAIVKGTGYRLTSKGEPVSGNQMDGKVIKAYLQSVRKDIKVFEVTHNSVVVQMTGFMTSSYGINSSVKVERIDD